MLALFAIGLVVVFFIALRLGMLDRLPAMFGRRPDSQDPEQARRLEVFRDYIDGEPKDEE